MNDTPAETRVRFAAGSEVNAAGEFEILAITAGDGNGWQFSPAVLQELLSLWDGAECFVDHDQAGARSVRDLGGVVYQPTWDDARAGIRLRLRAMGPAGLLVVELGRAMLAGDGPKPAVGFSADIRFIAKNKEVIRITKVFSVDLVFEPARGGEFIRQIFNLSGTPHASAHRSGEVSRKDEERTMEEKETTRNEEIPAKGAFQTELDAMNKIKAHATALVTAPARGAPPEAAEAMRDELAAMRQVRLQACGLLLDTALDAVKLPAPLAESIRGRFSSQLFEPEELNKAIEEGRKLVSALTGGAAVQGPGRINGVFDTRDQLQAAVDDLLGAQRDAALSTLKVHKLQGIRELYMMLTGDYDLHGGYHPDRVRLATTSDFTGLVKNALNKLSSTIGKRWARLVTTGGSRSSRCEHFNSLNSITGVIWWARLGICPACQKGRSTPSWRWATRRRPPASPSTAGTSR